MAELTREQVDAYVAEQKRREAVYAWRKERSAELPVIMSRVFALRGAGYYGGGFQYALEARAGVVMARLSPEHPVVEPYGIVDEIGWESLIEDIESAEETATQRDGEDRNRFVLRVISRIEPQAQTTRDAADVFLRLADKHERRQPTSPESREAWLYACAVTDALGKAVLHGYVEMTGKAGDVLGYAFTPAGEARLAELKAEAAAA